MIYNIAKTSADDQLIKQDADKAYDSFDYSKVIVKKPWGYEYLVFENECVAIWLLQIVRKRKTSMHCHPRKTTGLILLTGYGIFHSMQNSIALHRMDAINIDAGVFHATEAQSVLPIHPISENGIWVMEIESPPFKTDLCRMADAYGRAGTSYEGRNQMVFEPKETLKLEQPRGFESMVSNKYQDLTFNIHRGPLHPEADNIGANALVCIIGKPAAFQSANPYLQVGRIYPFKDFHEQTHKADLNGFLLLTIVRETNRVKLTDYMASYLANLGVKYVFAVSGGAAMHLVDSFGTNPDIRYVATHHEQAAAMAAEGYARVSEGLGAALVTSGPGGTNALTGLMGAWIDSIPVIFISGQVTQDTLINKTGLRQFGIQEGNIIDIVSSVTKYAVTVTDANTIRYHLEKACYLAMTGRMGPVWLDIPLDVQSKVINPEEQRVFKSETPSTLGTTYPLGGLVTECIKMLQQSQRPALIYGYGVRLAKAGELLRQLVARLEIPTISSWTASDLVPSDDMNYIGRSGIMGDRAGNFTVQNADLLLIIGSRMSIPQVGYNVRLFARAAKKIMVDIDPAELNKPSIKPDLPLLADAGAFLQELLAQVTARNVSLNISAWRQRCREWKKIYPVVLPEYAANKHRVNSFYFIDLLAEKLGNDAVIVTDMGTSFTCTMQTFKTKMGQRLFTSSGFSPMGFGLPGAIGACLARNRKKTILITGDGGLQMNIQELQTLVHYKLPVIMFVLNNEGYLTIKLMQQNHFGRYVGSDPSSGVSCPDILKVAKAYGIKSVRISNQDELRVQLDGVLAESGPFVCEIMMPADQPLIPRVSSLKLPDGTIISKPLEDLYPFLPREEFFKNMIIAPIEILNK